MRNSLLLTLALVSACDKDSDPMGGPDAAMTADASTDAQDPPLTGVANVVVASYSQAIGAPAYVADASVVFYKPDGTVGTVVKTDVMGKASATIERNSLVAVVNGGNYVHVDTAIASPGDTLRFGPTVLSREPYGQVTVSWPARVIPGYTVYYYVNTPCGYLETTSTAASMPLYKGCAGSSFDVVVTSRRSSQETTGIMARRNVVPTGATVAVNLGDNAATWNVGSFTSVQLVNLPNAGQTPSTTCGGLQYMGSMPVNGTGASVFSGDTCSMRLLPDPMTTWSVEAHYARNDVSRFELHTRQSMPQNQLAPIDGTGSLPWITNLAYDPNARQVVWAAEGPAPLDASSLRIEVSASPRYLVWRVYAPNGLPTTFKLPKLPAELAMYDLLPTDVPRLELDNFDWIGVSASDVFKHSLDEEHAFFDKARRGATARTP